MLKSAQQLLALTGALGVVSLIAAGPAAAHVHADENNQPAKGGYGLVTLIVPTESETASTVGLTVTIPEDVNLTSARTLPIAGWNAVVDTEPGSDGERVSTITWKATGDTGLKPSEFGQFTFSAGPWPSDVDSVALVSDQAYSDGSVVAWNEIAVDSASEPEHPAPVVTLGAADEHSHGDEHDAATVEAGVARGEAWIWQATSMVSLVVAVSALIVVLRRSRGTGS